MTTLRGAGITPHVAELASPAFEQRATTRPPRLCLRSRSAKLVEQAFGWIRTVGLMRKLRHRRGGALDWMPFRGPRPTWCGAPGGSGLSSKPPRRWTRPQPMAEPSGARRRLSFFVGLLAAHPIPIETHRDQKLVAVRSPPGSDIGI